MKIIGEIPARYSSKRVKNKNLRDLNGQPMIKYAIDSAKKSKYLNDIYVNTENNILGNIALKNGVKFYKRNESLASDKAKQEDFNYDFIVNTKADVLVMINPVCPLINEDDIDNVIKFFLENNYDTVITVEETKMQAFYKNMPININTEEILQPTQNNFPIQICSWAITVWRSSTFIKSYEEKGYAAFNGQLGFFSMERSKCLKISYEEDFRLAEFILKSKF